MYPNSVPNPLAPIQNQRQNQVQGPNPTASGVVSQIGQQVIGASAGPITIQFRTVAGLKASMGESAFHQHIASDIRVVAALNHHFSAYQAGSEKKGIEFFQEQGPHNINLADPRIKAATLLVSDLCVSEDSSYKANALGLDELRSSLKLLVPELGATDIDCVLLHYALNLGAGVSNEGWLTQTQDEGGYRQGVMAGPIANAIHENRIHCLQVLAEKGAFDVNAKLPVRAWSMLGTKDSPSLLSLAAYSGNSQAVALMLTHGADANSDFKGQRIDTQNSPLAIALRINSPDLANLLVKHGADASRPLYLTKDVHLNDPNAYPVRVNPAAMTDNGGEVFTYVPQNQNDIGFTRFSTIRHFAEHVIENTTDRSAMLKALQG